jgi:hypothetical protein
MITGWRGWWLVARIFQYLARMRMSLYSFFLQTLKEKKGIVLQYQFDQRVMKVLEWSMLGFGDDPRNLKR